MILAENVNNVMSILDLALEVKGSFCNQKSYAEFNTFPLIGTKYEVSKVYFDDARVYRLSKGGELVVKFWYFVEKDKFSMAVNRKNSLAVVEQLYNKFLSDYSLEEIQE